jgi:hypothetical protein
MDLLPDYTDYNASVYEDNSKIKLENSKNPWYYPVIWFFILIVVIMAAGK